MHHTTSALASGHSSRAPLSRGRMVKAGVRAVSNRNPHSHTGTWQDGDTGGVSSAARGWNRSEGKTTVREGVGRRGVDKGWRKQSVDCVRCYHPFSHSLLQLKSLRVNHAQTRQEAKRLIMALLQDKKSSQPSSQLDLVLLVQTPQRRVAHPTPTRSTPLARLPCLDRDQGSQVRLPTLKRLESATHSPLPLSLVLSQPRSRHRPQSRIHSTPRQSPC